MLSAAAAQQQQQKSTLPPNAQQPQQSTPPTSTNQKQSNTGTVTKILDNFGFIDDSIFFSLSVVKGASVKVGDKVYFECTFDKNLPFNWNAQLVQLLATPLSSQQQSSSSSSLANSQQQKQQYQSSLPSNAMHHQSNNRSSAPSSAATTYHHQQPQAPGNYSIYHHAQQQMSQAGVGGQQAPPSASSYYASLQQQQQQQQSKPMPYVGQMTPGTYQQPPPQQQQQQHPHHHHQPQSTYASSSSSASTPQQQQPNTVNQQPGGLSAAAAAAAAASAVFTDFAKVQQAVATAHQLAQFYTSSPTATNNNNVQQQQQAANVTATNQGLPPNPVPGVGGGQTSNTTGSMLQYTSTPGSAFIASAQQFNAAHLAGQKPVGANAPPQHGGSFQTGPSPNTQRNSGLPSQRWEDNRYDQKQHGGGSGPPMGRRDDRPSGRFGGPSQGGPPKSRFNDPSEHRFGPNRHPTPPINDDHRHFGGGGFGGPPQSEHFRRADDFANRENRKEEPSRFSGRDNRERDRDRERERQDRENKLENRDNTRNKDNARSNIENRNRVDRDRHAGGGSDRERDRSNRDKRSISPSPSVTSSTGVASRNSASYPTKRRFEPCNIPKVSIIKNRYNTNELKSRLPGSIHVPSDLKEVIFNVESDFNLLDIPKPIGFKIINDKSFEKSKSEKLSSEKSSKDKESSGEKTKNSSSRQEENKPKSEKSKSSETKEKNLDDSVDESKETKLNDQKETVASPLEENKTNQSEKEDKVGKTKVSDEIVEQAEVQENTVESMQVDESSQDTQQQDRKSDESVSKEISSLTDDSVCNSKPSPASSKPSSTSNSSSNKIPSHKYNVKVLLLELPQLAEIYDRLFGGDFLGPSSFAASIASSGSSNNNTSKVSHFNKLLYLLVTRNSNDGFSMIGGKFVKELDGVLPGTDDQPNLVATSIRVVYEQTGMNLSACRQWRVLSSFIYNRESVSDASGNASYEVTKIYFPDLWSALNTIYQPLEGYNKSSESKSSSPLDNKVKIEKQCLIENKSKEGDSKSKSEEDLKVSNDTNVAKKIQDSDGDGKKSTSMEIFIKDIPENEKKSYLESLKQQMQNFKVSELKTELDKMSVKYESRWKKDQLYQRLAEVVEQALQSFEGTDAKTTSENVVDLTIDSNTIMMVDGDEEQNSISTSKETDNKDSNQKRKLSDEKDKPQSNEQEATPNSKKIKLDSGQADGKSSSGKSFIASSSAIKVKGNFTTVSLSSALNPHRFDQFELAVVAELLRDSLIIHFARYIYSALISNGANGGSSSKAEKSTEKPRTVAPNYVHLAFSFFDKNSSGSIPNDDLFTLLNSTGFSVSRKVFNSLMTSITTANKSSSLHDRLVYTYFQPPSSLLSRHFNYPSINNLNFNSISASLINENRSTGIAAAAGPLIIERNSIQYNVDELIEQSETDQKTIVVLKDSLIESNKKIAQLEESVSELEIKQKKMSAATGRQNDELCAVKRERDQLKTKHEQFKKFWSKASAELTVIFKQYDKNDVSSTGDLMTETVGLVQPPQQSNNNDTASNAVDSNGGSVGIVGDDQQ